jgi:head-tail adaptor
MGFPDLDDEEESFKTILSIDYEDGIVNGTTSNEEMSSVDKDDERSSSANPSSSSLDASTNVVTTVAIPKRNPKLYAELEASSDTETSEYSSEMAEAAVQAIVSSATEITAGSSESGMVSDRDAAAAAVNTMVVSDSSEGAFGGHGYWVQFLEEHLIMNPGMRHQNRLWNTVPKWKTPRARR